MTICTDPQTMQMHTPNGRRTNDRGMEWYWGMTEVWSGIGLFNIWLIESLRSRVDLHTPKMLIIQFRTSSVWENACHTIFIQFLKMVENWYKVISVAV